jgi:hypothetical protein
MMKRFALLALFACALQSQAQTTAIPGAPAPTPAVLPTSPAKKELVSKLLVLQRSGIESLARSLAERPAAQMMQGAGQVLQQKVPADKREEVAKAIEADLKKYVDDAVPLLRDRAVKLAPSTIGTSLEERFTEDELKQLLAWLESPVNKKYQQVTPEIQEAFVAKLVGDSRDVIEPKLKALEASVGKRLGVGPAAAAPGAPASGAAPKKK